MTRPSLDEALLCLGCVLQSEATRERLTRLLRLIEADADAIEADLRAWHHERLGSIIDRFVSALTFLEVAALLDGMGCASARLIDASFVEPDPWHVLSTTLHHVLFEVFRFGYFGLFLGSREDPRHPGRPWVLAFPHRTRHQMPGETALPEPDGAGL